MYYPFADETYETISLFKYVVQAAILSLYVKPQSKEEALKNKKFEPLVEKEFER